MRIRQHNLDDNDLAKTIQTSTGRVVFRLGEASIASCPTAMAMTQTMMGVH
jgi:hypothetical protein